MIHLNAALNKVIICAMCGYSFGCFYTLVIEGSYQISGNMFHGHLLPVQKDIMSLYWLSFGQNSPKCQKLTLGQYRTGVHKGHYPFTLTHLTSFSHHIQWPTININCIILYPS